MNNNEYDLDSLGSLINGSYKKLIDLIWVVPKSIEQLLIGFEYDKEFSYQLSNYLCHEVLQININLLSGKEYLDINPGKLSNRLKTLIERLSIIKEELSLYHKEYFNFWENGGAKTYPPTFRKFIMDRPFYVI